MGVNGIGAASASAVNNFRVTTDKLGQPMSQGWKKIPAMNPISSFKPSAFYYRQALREADSLEEILTLSLELVCELERHKEWIRAHGLVPPKWMVTRSECEAKRWAPVVPIEKAD